MSITQNDWLDLLKSGDQVAVRLGTTTKKYTLATIVKIPTTPRGRFVLDNGAQFDRQGVEWGKERSKLETGQVGRSHP